MFYLSFKVFTTYDNNIDRYLQRSPISFLKGLRCIRSPKKKQVLHFDMYMSMTHIIFRQLWISRQKIRWNPSFIRFSTHCQKRHQNTCENFVSFVHSYTCYFLKGKNILSIVYTYTLKFTLTANLMKKITTDSKLMSFRPHIFISEKSAKFSRLLFCTQGCVRLATKSKY